MGAVQRQALMRLFHALGASQLGGSVCGASGEALAAEGHPVGYDPEEIVHSDFIVLWGSNVLSTCHHHWHFIEQARRRGARVVVIDPRLTQTGKRSDQHIAIKPGSDAILAAGLARIMVDEKLVNLDAARSLTSDFDDFLAQIEPWTSDQVSAACEIEENVIIGLAREIAAARPALLKLGVGPQQTAQGDALVRGVSALSILGGHWQQPGGGMFLFAEPEFDDYQASCPELITGQPRTLDMATLGSILTDCTLTPPIMGLMIWASNPAISQINAAWVRRGLSRNDLFTVVLDHFLTDTARYADIVLPSTTQLEHFDLQGAWGHHYISANLPAIAPLGESKSNGEVMRELAKRLGLAHPQLQQSDEEIAASALPPHLSLSDLKEHGWQKASPPRMQLEDFTPGLRLVNPDIFARQPQREGTLKLLTPKSHYFLNSIFANMPRQRKDQGGPYLDMHPDDAEERDIVDQQAVMIFTDRAKIKATLRLTDAILPGVVALEGKWWDQPEDTAAVSNLLSKPIWSPAGQPAFNDTFVQVAGVIP
jgi:anaerobic selenocysteine-containing dehydrogenase